VPDDPRSPFVTSGLRIGTPSVTTQGMAEPEMARIADLIGRVLRAPSDDAVIDEVRGEVRTLCEKFPVY
jgi:glycine hydroxymethyltransferase